QSHGILFVLSSAGHGIEQVSENLTDLLGLRPEDVVGRPFGDLLESQSRGYAEEIIDHAAKTFTNPFSIRMLNASGRSIPFNAIAHTIEGGSTVIELEPVALERGASSLDGYFRMVQASLAESTDLDEVRQVADLMAKQVKDFTGFDRVMIYRFAPDDHGEVIAEALEEGMEPYLHLHFPASDIPPQARELYLRTWVRLLYDVDAPQASLFPSQHPRIEGPLPMGDAVLRSLSPVHLEYLRNMGVAATLTISLVVEGRLWGLIACHHRTPHFVSYGMRATASFYGVIMSAQILRVDRLAEDRGVRFATREISKMLARMDRRHPLGTQLRAELDALARVFEADGIVYYESGAISKFGSCPSRQTLVSAISKLEERYADSGLICDRAKDQLPEITADEPLAMGLIAISFATDVWLLILRSEQPRVIKWGGNPNRKVSVDDRGKLRPRNSFSEWVSEVRGQALPWPSYIDQMVDELRTGLSSFLFENTRHLESVNDELEKFAGVIAHEVKSQLQSPTMVLGLVESLPQVQSDAAVHEMVSIGAESLRTLSHFTTEMLSFARADREDEVPEEVDVAVVVDQVLAQLSQTLKVESMRSRFVVHKLPTVSASKSLLSHLISNLVRNALLHGPLDEQGDFCVEIGAVRELESARDRNSPVFFVRDNGRGIAEADQERIFEYFQRGGGENRRGKGSGIGLGFVSRLLERGGGRIWLESQPGKGATFFFTLSEVVESDPSDD
ncbi:MAG: ATP-binding protein, partial [Verrucomicrobiales bacterium]